MAGIGFKLQNIIKENSISSIGKAYGYAAMLNSGPWVSTMIAILIIGFFNLLEGGENQKMMIFQLIVTYAFAVSSIFTGFIQLPFTRYIADKIYQQKEDEVLPSYFGTLLAITSLAYLILTPIIFYIFPNESLFFKILVMNIFIVMINIWIANVLASGLKFYKEIFISYFSIYMIIVVLSYYLGTNIEKILSIFLLGNLLLFMALTIFIMISYPSKKLLSFEFFRRKNFYWFLAFSALFYNTAIWIDKFIFWYYPYTGTSILGKLHMSIVYDIPIFMAYLTIAFGMALFFFRIEAYFSQEYARFYKAVTEGGNLKIINEYKRDMADVIRQALRDIIYLQSTISIIIYIYTPEIFSFFKIPLLYSSLFHIDMIGAGLQLGFMSVLALLYYLDKRRATMWLSLIFLILNATLTMVSIYLGPYFFGYGYSLSLLIVFIISLGVIKTTIEDIEYETFLLR
jgi:uncharacterized membrane protein